MVYVIIYISGQYYMRNGMTEKQGINVVIDDSSKLPNVISEHMPLYPHSSTDIGLTIRNILRLEAPYPSDCRDEYPEMYKNMTSSGKFDFSYSEKTCQSMCHNYYIHKYCGCYRPQIIEGSLGWGQFSDSTFCAFNLTKTSSCDDEARDVFVKSNYLCQCFPECVQPVYQVYLYKLYKTSSKSILRLLLSADDTL